VESNCTAAHLMLKAITAIMISSSVLDAHPLALNRAILAAR
jgi:hypothetical protein